MKYFLKSHEKLCGIGLTFKTMFEFTVHCYCTSYIKSRLTYNKKKQGQQIPYWYSFRVLNTLAVNIAQSIFVTVYSIVVKI